MPIRFALILFFISAAARPAGAQNDALAQCMRLATGTTYAGYVPARNCLYESLRTADTATAKTLVAHLESSSIRRDAPYLHLYARTAYVEYVLRRRVPWPADSMLGMMEEVVATAKRLGDAPHIAWAECNLANGQFGTGRHYDQAFETALRVYHRVRAIPEAAMPDRGDVLGIIANFYYYFGEYRQAIAILTEAVRGAPSPGRPPSVGRRCYNTLGLCYRQLGRYDSSDNCFRAALLNARREGDSAWVSIIRGNLGINLYHRGRFREAGPLLAGDVSASVARADWDNAAGSLLPLAGIALKEGVWRKQPGCSIRRAATSPATTPRPGCPFTMPCASGRRRPAEMSRPPRSTPTRWPPPKIPSRIDTALCTWSARRSGWPARRRA